MVQVYVDYSNNKITGYSTAVQAEAPAGDAIQVDDSFLKMLESADLFDRLYYIDGEVKVGETEDGYYRELKEIDAQLVAAREAVNNEHKTFMDNILSGMGVDAVASISRDARGLVESLERQKEGMVMRHQESVKDAVNDIFRREEEALEPEHFLSMVTVVRDENPYLEEWVRYHIEEMGFGHFYIYDNESGTPVREYLESVGFPYLDMLTIIPWRTSRATQEDSHNDFLRNHSKETRWFLAADPDEYVVLKDGSQTLVGFLEGNSQYATIECLWRHYNANGQVYRTDGTDMERFTQSTDWEGWKHGGKRFAQSNRIARFQSYVPIERMGALTLGWEDAAATGFFQLNHYFTRSWEEWQQKIRRGSSNPGYRRKLSMFFELNPDMAYLDTGEDLEQGYGASQEGGGSGQEAGDGVNNG